MLGIGADAYLSTRLQKIFDKSDIVLAGFGGGMAASSPLIASIFFPAGGMLGLLGLGTAVTPVGWVIASAVVAGIGYKGLKKFATRVAGPVEVIPRFINSPIDLLAASLFDVMAPIMLKVSHVDGENHDTERQRMHEYFTETWGYNSEYVELGLEYAEATLSDIKTEEIVKGFAEFCKNNRDCNLPSIRLNIEGFILELINADGRVTVEENRELNKIREAFKQHENTTGVIWRRVAATGESSVSGQ